MKDKIRRDILKVTDINELAEIARKVRVRHY